MASYLCCTHQAHADVVVSSTGQRKLQAQTEHGKEHIGHCLLEPQTDNAYNLGWALVAWANSEQHLARGINTPQTCTVGGSGGVCHASWPATAALKPTQPQAVL